jgi:tetratricopeptide (TPR) repeat protein
MTPPGSCDRRTLSQQAIAWLVGASLVAGCGRGAPQRPTTVPGLGSLAFPVTTSAPEARLAFERGALLLHLFHYDEAREAFRQAEAADPGLAMAYWGEAMAWNYTVWNEQQPDSARAVLARLGPTPEARRAKARTPREAGFLDAVELLYGEGPKAHRDTLYEAAMDRLSKAHPDDDEITLFHALALLGLNQGVRDLATYARAADLIEPVFRRSPEHPGASHYLIHAVDDPDHAARGLDPARELARSSPDASHAQHMTSHIFMALGMWDDVVRANENAMRVVNAERAKAGRGPSYCGHYNTWLNYGYLEQGRVEDARTLTRACEAQAEAAMKTFQGDATDPDATPLGSAVFIWARYVLDSESWTGDDIAWNPGLDTATTSAAADYHFVQSVAAARRKDLGAARAHAVRFRALESALGTRFRQAGELAPEDAEYLRGLAVMGLELDGLIRIGAGDREGGLALLRQATVKEDSLAYAFGPPAVLQPSHELLGRELLAAKRPADAEAEFRAGLAGTPRRTASLEGLAQALRMQQKTGPADSIAAELGRIRAHGVSDPQDPPRAP